MWSCGHVYCMIVQTTRVPQNKNNKFISFLRSASLYIICMLMYIIYSIASKGLSQYMLLYSSTVCTMKEVNKLFG